MQDDLPEGQMLFTMKEVSKYLNISLPSLHRWIRKGTFHPRKVGKQWRVPREEVKRLLGESEQSSLTHQLVMPDDEDQLRNPWVGLIERGDLVEFLEQRVLRLAKESKNETTMKVLLDGFTTQDLQNYRASLKLVIGLTDAILEERTTNTELT